MLLGNICFWILVLETIVTFIEFCKDPSDGAMVAVIMSAMMAGFMFLFNFYTRLFG